MTIELDDKQKESLRSIVKWYRESDEQVFHVYGYAGTGKSTIVNQAIADLKDGSKCKKVVTAAYTGKAASVLQKKGVPDAITIHQLLYYPLVDEKGALVGWTKRDETAADLADLVVLDECSLIGGSIASDIKALKKKILVIGDPGQLPPIGDEPGFFTKRPEVFLDQIHRQAADNPIIRLATMVRNGEKLPIRFAEGDVYIAPLDVETRAAIFEDTQVLCGTHASRYNYTRLMRERLGITSDKPQAGEPIICCKTNYRKGLFNGFMGYMGELEILGEETVNDKGEAVRKDVWKMDAYLDDLEKPATHMTIDPYLFLNHYAKQKFDALPDKEQRYCHFDYSYLVTAHKAQGSSFKHVTIIDDSDVFKENAAKWLYTALTRAEEGLVLLRRKYK